MYNPAAPSAAPATSGDPDPLRRLLASGECTHPRFPASGFVSAALSQSGVLQLAFFTALRSERISRLALSLQGASTGGVSFIRAGIYNVDPVTYDLTSLAASIANDPTIGNAPVGQKVRNLLAPFNKVKGNVYALGYLETNTGGTNRAAMQCHATLSQTQATNAGPWAAIASPPLVEACIAGPLADLPASAHFADYYLANGAASPSIQAPIGTLLP